MPDAAPQALLYVAKMRALAVTGGYRHQHAIRLLAHEADDLFTRPPPDAAAPALPHQLPYQSDAYVQYAILTAAVLLAVGLVAEASAKVIAVSALLEKPETIVSAPGTFAYTIIDGPQQYAAVYLLGALCKQNAAALGRQFCDLGMEAVSSTYARAAWASTQRTAHTSV